jgi:hypothetical protein
MARTKKLCVEADGKRNFITVPVGRAAALHGYLREHHVRSAPPAPAYTGFDSIELDKNVDVSGVQSLLNDWA